MTKANAQCNNVTYAGSILRPANTIYGGIPDLIMNAELPLGGDTTQPIEYVWLKTEDSLTVVGITWNVENIHEGLESSYQPTTPIYGKTWYRRCARRQGCTDYIGESNWVQVYDLGDGLPVTIKTLEFSGDNILWEVYETELFSHLLLKGSYGGVWKELGIYTQNRIDISEFDYNYYQLFFYDIDYNKTISSILYRGRRIIQDDALIGVSYIIYNNMGSVISKGVYKEPLHLKWNELIKLDIK